MKKIFFLIMLNIFLLARENPFSPIIFLNKPSMIENKQFLNEINFSFPQDARILKSITFNYIDLNANERNFKININESVNFNEIYSLINKNNYEKSRNIKQNKENDKELLQEKIIKDEDNLQQQTIQNKADKQSDFTYMNNAMSLEIKDNIITINSYFKLLRRFMLKNPNRLVFDFQITTTLKNDSKILENNLYLKKIDFGVHQDFYRVVFTLNGLYDYSLDINKNIYKLELK
ncbi:AMIN domain-containing protein [Campylobacter canadensis]|uniref:AMIN domain-containing protein n=1 Tax=Campylobacter canadensis TaxID=449520 RepID=A0ABS7WQP8_9BACT|nr:AMIN domain-containing protein [Campylobacter canadensis]MBZ7987106.1 AMIN domain-containing protein [Campylobacter canadensis]MBZ7994720.1 AMIN domain-containing protein [Campylobacter canadensis]MBZ7996216.1 AMIN domain-containing protein [Campylobacter canadensis]MBZ7998142.1 AMIN domain-containing protein [Campylobacter canadensis]MBZ7999968.1 AMIN domain-containing protein [Campylobacter canadensis]